MDEDADGVVNVTHVMKVIELLGKEKMQLSGKQINNIIDMLEKEEMLEVESNIETLLIKSEPADKKKKKKDNNGSKKSEGGGGGGGGEIKRGFSLASFTRGDATQISLKIFPQYSDGNEAKTG